MGASQEGKMSVRDRINLVLADNLSLLLQGGDEGGPGREGGGSSSVSTTTAGLANSSATSPLVGSSSLSTRSVPSASGSTSNSGSGSSNEVNSGEPPTPRGESRLTEGLSSFNAKTGDGEESAAVLQRLLANNLKIINALNQSVMKAEAKCKVLESDRDQLQTRLESTRSECSSLVQRNGALEEQCKKAAVTIKDKEEKINELERRLAAATLSKPVNSRGTAMTPVIISPLVNINTDLLDEFEDDEMFPRKRRKLNSKEAQSEETTPKILKPQAFPYSPSFIQTCRTSLLIDGRIDSPPQLSPAITPNSSLFKGGARGIESKGFLHRSRSVNDDEIPNYSLDEFHDELELDRIQYLSQFNNKDKGTRSQIVSTQRLLPSSSSAFSRPSPRSHQVDKTLNSDGRRSESGSSQKPMHHLHQQPTTSTALVLYNNSSRDILAAQPSRELPQLISIRNNNFLNMSRPIARKPPMVPIPNSAHHSSQDITSFNHSPQQTFRSLDSSISSNTANKSTESSLTPVVKKRGVGRPPGSLGPKKRLPSSTTLFPVGNLDVSLSNGILDDIKPDSPPPRFSKRGRLLKPNRARYSPDPDVSTHSREKFMTTKKNYYVSSEPFIFDGYGGTIDSSLSGDAPTPVTGFDSLSRQGIADEDSCGPLATEAAKEVGETNATGMFVEVPRFRLVRLEGFSDGEERVPPDDDMSDEVYLKRHQKLEAQEKQRKRWDMQALREESYKERMQRKQAEREMQKELRRQQRKRKGRTGTTEEEVVNPSVENIRAIYVGDVLPVGAFGQTLPVSEKVDFHFSIGCASTQPRPPSSKSTLTATADSDTELISSTVRDSGPCSSSTAPKDVVKIKQEADERLGREAKSAGKARDSLTVSHSSPPPPSELAQPSPTPPPPSIFCIRDNNNDVYEYTEDDEMALKPASISEKFSFERESERKTPLERITSSEVDGSICPDSSLSPSSARTSSTRRASRIKPSSSITIPLSVPVITGRINAGMDRKVSISNQRSGVVRIPHLSPSLNAEPRSKVASIKFFIPNIPLTLAKAKMSSVTTVPSYSSTGSTSNSAMKGNDAVSERGTKDKNVRS